jgi:hypothetical protein
VIRRRRPGAPVLVTASAVDPAAYELAYREGIRALEEQERAVGETRSRAGQLIAAAAITTSFFGSQAITDHHIHLAGWCAIGCFVGLSVSVLVILWPREDWQFVSSPASLIANYLEPGDLGPAVDLPSIHRDLALHMATSIENNKRQLRWAFRAFRVGAVLLTGEVVAWVIALVFQ